MLRLSGLEADRGRDCCPEGEHNVRLIWGFPKVPYGSMFPASAP